MAMSAAASTSAANIEAEEEEFGPQLIGKLEVNILKTVVKYLNVLFLFYPRAMA